MSDAIDTETIDGTVFELCPVGRPSQTPESVFLRKNRNFANRYLSLTEEFQNCRMVEVGVDQGGSTSFFLKLFRPENLLAIELSDTPVDSVMNFLAKHDREKKVGIHWGVDQSDPVRVPELVEATFAGQPLDLVVDDASHLLKPTTATFEMLFPRLRSGGLYVIEDWSWRHLKERGINQAICEDTSGALARRAATALDPTIGFEIPMSFLICQLVIAAGFNLDWITDIRATDGFCEIRRGDAEIPPGTPISDYLGYVGNRMLDMNNA